MSHRPKPATAPPPSVGDAALAAGAFVFTIVGAFLLGVRSDEPDLGTLGVVVLAAQCAPLVWRRSHPVAVWAATGLAAVVYGLAEWPDPLIAVGSVIALATVFECCSRRTAAVVWCLSVAAAVAGLIVPGDSDSLDVWIAALALVLAPVIGDRQKVHNAYMAQLEQADLLHRDERRRAIEDAREAERRHLARELHDVVAHHVSMMVVQAEAGAAQLPGTRASGVMDELAGTGRRTLAELRVMLQVMAEGEGRAPTAPQPGIGEIPELVEEVRRSGVSVELEISGQRRELGPAVSLSAYRIVQEGLTNVIKHARSAHAEVALRYRPAELEITVIDDGPPSRSPPGSGRGLHGLRERAELLEGRFDAAPRTGGGFELRAVLPTRAAT